MNSPSPPPPPAPRRRLALAVLALVWLAAWVLIAVPRPLAVKLVTASAPSAASPGWRVEQDGRPLPAPWAGERLELAQPNTSLKAVAVWRVKGPGRWRLLLECDNYGWVRLDGRRVLWRQDPTPGHGADFHNDLQPGQHLLLDNKVQLSAGPHLIEAGLDNLDDRGFLRIQVREPGQRDFRPLTGRELGYPSLAGALGWLAVAGAAPWLGVALLVATGLVGIAWLVAWDARAMAWAPDKKTASLEQRKARIAALLDDCAQRLGSLELLTGSGRGVDALLLAGPLAQDAREAARLMSLPQKPPPQIEDRARRMRALADQTPGSCREVERRAEQALAQGARLVKAVRQNWERAGRAHLRGPVDELRARLRVEGLSLLAFGVLSGAAFLFRLV